ncbi:MAG: sugar ABC transporter ATP-binding protein, partial [Pseudomonadota bacterium]
NAGIAMIHQELQHVPDMSVAQNLFLGRPITKFGGIFTDRKAQEQAAADVLHGLDPTIDPGQRIADLRVAQRQLVEIARALIEDAKVVAMDEPTSSLTPAEFEKLVLLIERLAATGVSVIYVSHRMDEIFRLCDSSTILRDGSLVDTVEMNSITRDDIVQKMVGRTLMQAEHQSFATDEPIIRVEGLARPPVVRPCSFAVHKGEVLGIAGLVGSGRTELLRLIAGVDAPSAGQVKVNGRSVPPHDVGASIRSGIGLLPEERKRDGIIPMRSIASNVALPSLPKFSRGGIVHDRRVRGSAETYMREMDLRPFDVNRPIVAFSGGNQQKAIIGRWLAAGAEVLLFDEPTRGVDVGAKAEIYSLIERLASEGKAIIVVSSELPELFRVADRVLVMREGEISAELPRNEMTEEAIARAAIPGTDTAARGVA